MTIEFATLQALYNLLLREYHRKEQEVNDLVQTVEELTAIIDEYIRNKDE